MSSTNKTTNINLTQYIGTDIFNPLTDYNVDMQKIDTEIGKSNSHIANEHLHNQKLTCTKSGTVYNLTDVTSTTGIVECIFTIPVDYVAGDTFTVSDVAYTMKTSTGNILPSGIFTANSIVHITLDVDNKIINFVGVPSPLQINTASVTTKDITYYIDVTNGLDTNDGSQSNPFKTITHAINLIPQIINHTININVMAGTYNENVILSGLLGNGTVYINGGSDTTTAINYTVMTVIAKNCTVGINITGFNGVSADINNNTFYNNGSSHIIFKSCITTFTNHNSSILSRGFYTTYGNTVLNNCISSNKDIAYIAENCGRMFLLNSCSASGNTYVFESNTSSVINIYDMNSSNNCNGVARFITNGGEIIGYDGKSTASQSENLLINASLQVAQHNSSAGYQYAVDRWLSNWPSSAGNISCIRRAINTQYFLESSVTSVTGTNTMYHDIVQILEDQSNGYSSLSSKTVTFSAHVNCSGDYSVLAIKYTDSSNVEHTVASPTAIPKNYEGIVSMTLQLPADIHRVTVGLLCTRFLNSSDVGTYHNIWNMKLELGSVPTAFEQRPYAEELAMCQRYCLLMNGLENFRAVSMNSNYIEFFIPTPVSMRTTPTLNYAPTLWAFPSSTLQTGFTFGYSASVDGIKLGATKSSHGLSDGCLGFHDGTNDGKYIFDAEIY